MLLHPPGLPSASSSSSSSSSAGSGSDRPPPLTSDSLRAPNPIDVDEVSSEDEPPRRRSERIRRPVRRPQPVSAKRTITRCHSKSTSSSAQPAQPSNDGSDGEGPKEELADMAVDESEPAEDEDGNPNVYLTKPPKMKCRKFVEDYERERGTTLPADMRKNSMCPACIRRKGMDCTYFETEVRYGPVRAPSEDPQSGSGKKNKEEKTVGSRASSRKQQQRKGKGSPKQIGPPLMEVDANDSSAGDSTVAQRTRRASNEHGQMDKKPKEPGEPAAEEDMKDDENAQCTDDGNRSKNDFAHAEQRIQEEMQRLRDQWDTKCDELEKKLGQDIASAQAKNTSLSNSLAESSKNVWALGSRVSCLEEENKSLRCELGTCKETNAQLSSDLEKTAQQHNKQMHLKTQECTQLQQRVKDMEEMLRAEKRKTHEQTAKVTTLIAQQEQQMGDLGAQHRQSTLEMASAKAKVMDLTVECSKLQDDLSQATRKHAEEVKKRDDQILSMTNVTQTLEGTVRRLMALNTEKQQELDRASVDNKQYQQQIPELIEEVERLKKQITKLEDQLDDTKRTEALQKQWNDELAESRAQLELSRQEASALTNQLSIQGVESAGLRGQVSAQAQRLADLMEVLENSKKQADDELTKNAELMQEMSALQLDIKKLEELKQQFELAKEAKVAEQQRTEALQKQWNDELAESRAQLELSRQEASALTNRLSEETSDANLKAALNEVANWKEKVSQLNQQLKNINGAYSALEEEKKGVYTRLGKEMENLQKSNERADARTKAAEKRLQDQEAEQQAKVERVEKKLTTSDANLKASQHEVNKWKAKAQDLKRSADDFAAQTQYLSNSYAALMEDLKECQKKEQDARKKEQDARKKEEDARKEEAKQRKRADGLKKLSAERLETAGKAEAAAHEWKATAERYQAEVEGLKRKLQASHAELPVASTEQALTGPAVTPAGRKRARPGGPAVDASSSPDRADVDAPSPKRRPTPLQKPGPVIAGSGFSSKLDDAHQYSRNGWSRLRDMILRLGGTVIHSGTQTALATTVTHVVANPDKITRTVLAAALTGRWIVSADWVQKSMQARCWVEESGYGHRCEGTSLQGKKIHITPGFERVFEHIKDHIARIRAVFVDYGSAQLVNSVDEADIILVSELLQERDQYEGSNKEVKTLQDFVNTSIGDVTANHLLQGL
uniref:BRCT domain-containing protein n=1 Tax=Eutreptiella gymnastica TaxID=73025 RepID=A0A7S1I8R4_9EUGL